MTATTTVPALSRTELQAIRNASTLEQLGLSKPAHGPVPQLFRRRTKITAEAAGEFSTNGWDTVYAIRMPDVNKAITEKNAYPKDFSMVVDKSVNYTVSGQFGSWQMTRGGSGEILFFAMPITAGTMTVGDGSYSLDGGTCYVSLKLHYLAGDNPPGDRHNGGSAGVHTKSADAVREKLVVNTTPRGPSDPVATVQNLTLEQQPAPYIYALMKGAMEAWFNANISAFRHIFAVVDLNRKAAEADFQWLAPTYTGYAYHDGDDDASSLFGVLSMTEDRPADGVDYSVGFSAIPAGQRAGLSISMERFLAKLMLPGMPKVFENSSVSSFKLDATGSVLENTEPLQMPAVRVGAIDYTPYVQRMTLQVVGEEIQLDTLTQINISPGIRAMVQCTSYQRIIVVDKPDGSQTLSFEEARPSYINNWIDKDLGVVITEIIVGIVGAVAGGVAGQILGKTIKAVVAVILILLVAGFAAATPALIALVAGGGAAKALPPITLLVRNASAPVTWPTAAEFTLKSAALNGSFQLGGDPHFS